MHPGRGPCVPSTGSQEPGRGPRGFLRGLRFSSCPSASGPPGSAHLGHLTPPHPIGHTPAPGQVPNSANYTDSAQGPQGPSSVPTGPQACGISPRPGLTTQPWMTRPCPGKLGMEIFHGLCLECNLKIVVLSIKGRQERKDVASWFLSAVTRTLCQLRGEKGGPRGRPLGTTHLAGELLAGALLGPLCLRWRPLHRAMLQRQAAQLAVQFHALRESLGDWEECSSATTNLREETQPLRGQDGLQTRIVAPAPRPPHAHRTPSPGGTCMQLVNMTHTDMSLEKTRRSSGLVSMQSFRQLSRKLVWCPSTSSMLEACVGGTVGGRPRGWHHVPMGLLRVLLCSFKQPWRLLGKTFKMLLKEHI